MRENHIRGIATTLAHLDKVLCEFEQWAHGYEVRSVLYEVLNSLSETQRKMIASEVAQMKASLHEIKRTLNLDGTVRSVEKMIVGSCAVLWVSLVELEGNRLRRYGEAPQGLTEYLDPKVAGLIEHLRRIADLVGRDGSQ
jgi:hypothetical protein